MNGAKKGKKAVRKQQTTAQIRLASDAFFDDDEPNNV
jgi:hypothetical protein